MDTSNITGRMNSDKSVGFQWREENGCRTMRLLLLDTEVAAVGLKVEGDGMDSLNEECTEKASLNV